MGTLGIITCEVLALEFAYMLANDEEKGFVTVLENEFSRRFIAVLKQSGFPSLRCIPHISSYRHEPAEKLNVLIRVMEPGLHRNKRILRRALRSAGRELSCYADALFLGYGLCGNALDDPGALLDVNIPVFIPMDQDHPVDDCIALLLGGRKPYYDEQCHVPGTFFMTPGWSILWEKMLHDTVGGRGWDAIRRMFVHYERCVLILTPWISEEEMRKNTELFCSQLGLRSETRQGKMDILNESWNFAKAFLKSQAGFSPGKIRT